MGESLKQSAWMREWPVTTLHPVAENHALAILLKLERGVGDSWPGRYFRA